MAIDVEEMLLEVHELPEVQSHPEKVDHHQVEVWQWLMTLRLIPEEIIAGNKQTI